MQYAASTCWLPGLCCRLHRLRGREGRGGGERGRERGREGGRAGRGKERERRRERGRERGRRERGMEEWRGGRRDGDG